MASASGVGETAADRGRTVIAPGVVRTIAGIAARAAPGVHSLHGGALRGLGMNRDRRNGDTTRSTGVHVEVGERHVAVDLDVVVEYGASISGLEAGVRTGVTKAVERMTGLALVELSVVVADVHLTDVHLTDVHLTDVHLTDVHLTDVHLPDVHLTDVHLTDVHPADVHLPGPRGGSVGPAPAAPTAAARTGRVA